jgi:N-glycosylase/DNA lyase
VQASVRGGGASAPAVSDPTCRHSWAVRHYDLESTLAGGQAFRWQAHDGGWEGVVGGRWVRLTSTPQGLSAEVAASSADWGWLARYLRVDADLDQIIGTFPDDRCLHAAVAACRGLRLLRQEPWECLASFILSSTKRITHIRQIVERLCERYGGPVAVPPGHAPAWAFPSAERLAGCAETELRDCGMGFRAPYLLAAARRVAAGELDLALLSRRPLAEARTALIVLPGVGRKIADCVLLFALGFDAAFPVDVWVLKALRELYFPRRRPMPRRLLAFTESHFGPHAGYAQQYLFHYMRGRGSNVGAAG